MISSLSSNRLHLFCPLQRGICTLLGKQFNKQIQNQQDNQSQQNEESNDKKVVKNFEYPEYLEFYSKKYRTDQWTNLTHSIINRLNNDTKLYQRNDNPLHLISEGIRHHFSDYDIFEFPNPIVTVEANFDSLLIPKTHVSRSKSDCYYVNANELCRAHSSAHQLDCLNDKKSRQFVCIADVYRRDVVDSTHYPVFHQCEIFKVLDQIPSSIQVLEQQIDQAESNKHKQSAYTLEATNYAEEQLKQTVESYLNFLFNQQLEFKWIPAYFPFTTPSFELEIFYNNKWIEMLGCGVVKREILLKAGLDNHIAFACGLGLERLAMIKYDIPDIRLFWSKDTGVSSQFKDKSFKDLFKYSPISIYPQSPKDCSFWIDDNPKWSPNDFYDLVRDIGNEIIEQVYLIDEYVNKDGRKSNTFRIIYRSYERTLVRKEVVKIHENIKSELRKRFGFETRGKKMIIKTIKGLRNHWKKTIFFSGLLSYGGNYFHTNYKINCLMKDYCQNALQFGEQRLGVFAQPKHITVILNPRSKKSKSRKYFNDYVAPILHCAGYKVSIVETESQGQAVKLMEIMSNTDAVLIAGGSGTIQEAITGLLRRSDANQYAQILPVGFLPLGTNNRTFFKIYENDDYPNLNLGSKRLEEVKILADSAMKVLNDKQTNLNVMRIHNLDSQKTVFSLNKFEFGILSELSRQLPKYWYMGDFLAHYYVHLKSTLFKSLSTLELGPVLNLSYTEKCAGCSKCYSEFSSQKLNQAKQRSGGWFSVFRSFDQKKSDQLEINLENRMKKTINPDCGKWKTMEVDRIMNLQVENSPRADQPELKLKILKHSPDLTKSKLFDHLKNYPNQAVIEDGGQQLQQQQQSAGECSLELSVKDLSFDISALNLEDQNNNEENKIRDETYSAPTDSGKNEENDKLTKPSDDKNRLNFFIDDDSYDMKNNLEINSKLRKIVTFS